MGRHVIGTIVPPIESSGRDLERLMERIRADPAAFEQSVNENMRRNGERVSIAWTNRIVRDAHGEHRRNSQRRHGHYRAEARRRGAARERSSAIARRSTAFWKAAS